MNIKRAEKQRLLSKLAEKTKEDKDTLGFVLDSFYEIMKEDLKAGREVYFPSVGKFYFKKRKSGKSNLTGQYIPEHYQLKFKVNGVLARYIRVMSREM